jgi:hypothetical protein
MWYASKATDWPVGAAPANGPAWVPRQVTRPATKLPSANRCSTVPYKSGKLRRGHPLLEPIKAVHLARDRVVVNHVGSEQCIQGVEVACIDRLDDAAVGDFMLLCGHPRPPLNASRTSCGFVRITTWQSAQDDRVVWPRTQFADTPQSRMAAAAPSFFSGYNSGTYAYPMLTG